MRTMRTIRPIIGLAVISIAVAACAGATSAPDVQPPQRLDTVGAALSEAGSATAAPAPAAPETGGLIGRDSVVVRDDARIVRTGTLELEVMDVSRAQSIARDAIVALGGYVGASSTSNYDDRPTAQITYRIPVDRWEEALDALRDLNGETRKVVTEQTQAVEVTGQVIDLEARIRNLRASETALQGIAAKATKISDVLEVEARLTDVRSQIEQLTAQLEGLSDQAAYATLTVSFNSPVVAVTAATHGWEPAAIVDEAAASLVSIVQAVAGAGIWFLIVWLPILLVLGLTGGLAIWLTRRTGIVRRPTRPGPTPPAAPGPQESVVSGS